jgi:hypothetical protein
VTTGTGVTVTRSPLAHQVLQNNPNLMRFAGNAFPTHPAQSFIGGLRYGNGTLYTKDAGDLRVFWQGPTIGVDLGADGARTMMLVYNLPRTNAIYQQFNGIAGAAYFVAGLGMTALTSGDEHMVVVPIRSGLGLRLGYNVGYLKFTSAPSWNPF